jgi:hypothetical protein
LGLFFLHAELQDPQIEKQAKNNTKTGQSIKHVLKQQTEVQFVVFAFLGLDYVSYLSKGRVLHPGGLPRKGTGGSLSRIPAKPEVDLPCVCCSAGTGGTAALSISSGKIEKMKRSATDSKRDRDKYKKDTWERNSPDGETKGGRKKGGGQEHPCSGSGSGSDCSGDSGSGGEWLRRSLIAFGSPGPPDFFFISSSCRSIALTVFSPFLYFSSSRSIVVNGPWPDPRASSL